VPAMTRPPARRYFDATAASLHVRNYRLYVVGQATSVVGTWAQKLAQAWLVLELTDSAIWLGVVVAVQQAPTLLLTPWGGVLADRHSKRTMLIYVAAASAVPAFVLFLVTATDHATVPLVMMVAAVGGVLDAIERPTRHSFPGEMVGNELLANAVSLNNAVQDTGKTVGPAIGALVIAGVGLPYAFLVNAFSYAAVVGALLAMRPAELHTPTPIQRQPGQLRDALVYVRRTPLLLGPLMLLTAIGLFGHNWQVLIPLLGRQAFDGNATVVGVLLAALGAGSITGGVVLAGLIRPSPGIICLSAVILAGFFGVVAAAPTLTAALVAVFLVGASSVAFDTLASTWLQLTAVPAMRGRVVSLFVVGMAGTTPIGAPFVGWVASEFGSRAAWITTGSGCALAAALAYSYLRRTKDPELPLGVP
jgi:predicted MFS family arabinose efflux permease